MTPLRILKRAREAGLDMVAITDHNSAENVGAAVALGREMDVAVLPAMEIASSEEVHVLAVFSETGDVLDMQELVYRSIPVGAVTIDEYQVIVNERDEVLGFNSRLLIGATDMKLEKLVQEIHGRGGLVVASHVDRGAFSISSQLGFAPEGLAFDAFEVIDETAAARALLFHPRTPWLVSSDAHRLEDVGSRATKLHMEAPTFEELSMALHGEGGRSVRRGA
jgi:predicted metal-dependent phosphoesterase TrpH